MRSCPSNAWPWCGRGPSPCRRDDDRRHPSSALAVGPTWSDRAGGPCRTWGAWRPPLSDAASASAWASAWASGSGSVSAAPSGGASGSALAASLGAVWAVLWDAASARVSVGTSVRPSAPESASVGARDVPWMWVYQRVSMSVGPSSACHSRSGRASGSALRGRVASRPASVSDSGRPETQMPLATRSGRPMALSSRPASVTHPAHRSRPVSASGPPRPAAARETSIAATGRGHPRRARSSRARGSGGRGSGRVGRVAQTSRVDPKLHFGQVRGPLMVHVVIPAGRPTEAEERHRDITRGTAAGDALE